MATDANTTTASRDQVLRVCRECAAEIRDTARTAGPDTLDDADRKSLLILADLVEIRAGYKVALRPALETALDGAIGLLDAADTPAEDLEDGHDAELDFEGEATLGAPEQHHNQSKWGGRTVCGPTDHLDGELEPSLGAPERHPSRPYYPASMNRTYDGRQTDWAAGNNNPARDEGESEPGYDLPEGDDERCASGDIDESSLGAPENHALYPDQEHWAQGSGVDYDGEIGNEESSTDKGIPFEASRANEAVAKDARRQAEAMRRRKDGKPEPTGRESNIRPIGDGVMVWVR